MSGLVTALADLLRPCGPIVDPAAAERAREAVVGLGAWPALAPVFAASPYLATLAQRDPARLRRVLERSPDQRLEAVLQSTAALLEEPDPQTVKRDLRRLKAELHLLTALADLGGLWDLGQVTGALTRFADLAVQAALAAVARIEQDRGRLAPASDPARGPVPGLFCLALGKHGAGELNYSSDIDVSIFYAAALTPAPAEADRDALAVRLARGLAALLQERTADGYVFRIDLRLRPDPSSTPPAVPVGAALTYYEAAGQNWERAAMIKARPCAGDGVEARAFLAELRPFVWRRALDYGAIADIHAIKRQIHVHKVDERLSAPGHNLKLGAGGIREIEFFVQTQQLILGGRDPDLRDPRTLQALCALAAAGRVAEAAAQALARDYALLRAWEHRVQMVDDEQTHVLPEADGARARVAALAGFLTLGQFDAAVSQVLTGVNRLYGQLFAEDEPLSSRFGSLVFTGVEDDPETLLTLERMGFAQPQQVSACIRAWHHGRIAATRTERGRELFTRLTPRLLEAAHATGAPDAAFNRFGDFFSRVSSGVQIQSLFLAQPGLFELVVQVMAFAPHLGATLARQPGTVDAMLDASFFAPLEVEAAGAALGALIDAADGFETAMGAARRGHREQAFRIGVQLISGAADAEQAGRAFAALADACIAGLSRKALAEVERLGGGFPGEVAVVALGKTGAREMTAASDLDLMALYVGDDPAAASAAKGWSAETFYARFTQRLITALSAPTADGPLYAVDLQLRPSGRSGPVAVSVAGFERYYAQDAETWEFLALTRARTVWASSPALAQQVRQAIQAALRKPRDPRATAAEVADMRALMLRERPPAGDWDLKLTPGGLVDIEFAAQYLQLVHAAEGGPLHANTGEALAALQAFGAARPDLLQALSDGWRLQQDLLQLLRLAIRDHADPGEEPAPFQALLARAAGERDFAALGARLRQVHRQVRAALLAVLA